MSDATENFARCPATKKNGERCTALAGSDGYCIGHSPSAAEARRKGGEARSDIARSAKRLPARLRPVVDLLENILDEVHQGQLDPKQAQAISSLAATMVKVVSLGDIEERLRDVEARIEKNKSGFRYHP